MPEGITILAGDCHICKKGLLTKDIETGYRYCSYEYGCGWTDEPIFKQGELF